MFKKLLIGIKVFDEQNCNILQLDKKSYFYVKNGIYLFPGFQEVHPSYGKRQPS
jgi:hypothetical protein